MRLYDNLIPIVNRLHDVLEAIDPDSAGTPNVSVVDLPSIIVVGSQSSGKSSVLESLVQKDFLPRGRDIVTRRPLILQLVHTSGVADSLNASTDSTSSQYHSTDSQFSPISESNSFEIITNTQFDSVANPDCEELSMSCEIKVGEEWGEFAHLPGRRFTDFLLIRREIEEETLRLAGSNKVDLPGITKLPVGEQPPDIEAVIRKLVLDYASKPNSIILAITPANSDLANSDALKIAREADPQGLRTIGVLTKLDLMDAGTHAADILCNRGVFRLRLGFVGVVCRSQHDINVNKPIKEALKQEMLFFRTHQHYRAISHRCGSPFLAKELNKILLKSIKDQLPQLRSRINSLILETQAELNTLGDLGVPGSGLKPNRSGGGLLLKLLTLYVTDFNESIQGTATRCREVPGPFMGDDLIFDNPRVGGLSGGARINYIFNEIYTSSVSSIDGISGLTLDEVRNAIRNASGPRPSLFVPEASFEVLARKQIAKLGVPALKCADLVYEELGRLLRRIDRSELRRFPNLSARITEVAADLLRERMQPTQEMIESLIKIEMAYINTNHPDFSRSGAPLGVLAQIVDDRKSSAHVQGQQSHNYSRADNLGISNQRIDSEQANVGRMQRLNIEAGSPLNHEELPMISISSTAKSPNGRLDYTHGQTHSSFSNNQQPNSGFLSYLFRTHPQSPNNISQIHTRQQENVSIRKDDGNLIRKTVYDSFSEKEEVETQLIMTLLQSYLYIVRKNVLDSVPKAIMYLLVNHIVESLPTRLVTELYNEELFEELLVEDEAVVRHRARCKTALEAYRQAANIIGDLSLGK